MKTLSLFLLNDKEIEISNEIEKIIYKKESFLADLKNAQGKYILFVKNYEHTSEDYISKVLDKTKEEFMKVLEVNLVGTFLITKYTCLKMDKGTIINISSLDSTKTFNSLSTDYIASKAGVNTLTKTFSLEYKDIRFITLLLPWIKTSSVLEMNPIYLKEEMEKYGQYRLMGVDEVSKKIIEVINSSVPTGSIIEVNYD